MKNRLLFAVLFLLLAVPSVTYLHGEGSGGADSKKFNPVAKLLDAEIFDKSDGKIDVKSLEDKEYLAVYFSAHWCPPCRKFTPLLSDFYNKNALPDRNFELIFASRDKSDKKRAKYMKWGKMNYPYIKYESQGSGGVVEQLMEHLKITGIPVLVVFNKKGEIVAHSYDEKGNYTGPYQALTSFKNILGIKDSAPLPVPEGSGGT